MSFEIVKAGWLFRQSTVLKRWKKNWFVLYKDFILKWFESPDSHVAEDTLRMQTECLSIHTGTEVMNVTPPEGFGRSCLLKIEGHNDKLLVMCAESPDDMSAWKYALEQARIINANPPPYTEAMVQPQGMYHGSAYGQTAYPQQQTAYAYPGQVYYGSHPPAYVVQGQPGQTTVIYQQDPYHYRRGVDGGDVAVGMLAGAALGTMMWGPLLWW